MFVPQTVSTDRIKQEHGEGDHLLLLECSHEVRGNKYTWGSRTDPVARCHGSLVYLHAGPSASASSPRGDGASQEVCVTIARQVTQKRNYPFEGKKRACEAQR